MTALEADKGGKPMAWIQGRPHKPGFYFYRDELQELTVMQVEDYAIGLNEPPQLGFNVIWSEDLDDYPEGEHWSEPIAVPPELAPLLNTF